MLQRYYHPVSVATRSLETGTGLTKPSDASSSSSSDTGDAATLIRSNPVTAVAAVGAGRRYEAMAPEIELTYAKIIADYFEPSLASASRCREEYGGALVKCRDFRRLYSFRRSHFFDFLPYPQKRVIVQLAKCKNMVFPAPTKGRTCRMCMGCSMKFSFSEKRMNRMACCVCGGPIFSIFQSVGRWIYCPS